MKLSDRVTEGIAGIAARPGRALLTMFGTVLGIATVVATIGLTLTAANATATRFDALEATTIVIAPVRDSGDRPIGAIPWDGAERMARVTGVTAATSLTSLTALNEILTETVPHRDPSQASGLSIPYIAVSPSLPEAFDAELVEGRFFDEGHSMRASRVAVLGRDAAQRLGVHNLARRPAIFAGDDAFTVIGILRDIRVRPDLSAAVLIPEGTAREMFGVASPDEIVVRTQIGAATEVGEVAAFAVDSRKPKTLDVSIPLRPTRIRQDVAADFNSLYLVLGVVSIVVAGFGIANTTLMAVMERVGEIGLRFALGATRWDIASQFLLESSILGVLGGLIGMLVGLVVVVGASAINAWTPILPPVLLLMAPPVGAGLGLLFGAYPATQAAAMQPAHALRAGT